MCFQGGPHTGVGATVNGPANRGPWAIEFPRNGSDGHAAIEQRALHSDGKFVLVRAAHCVE